MLVPSFSLRLGDQIFGPQVATLRLRRARLPAVDRLDVSFPAGVPVKAAPGDDAELELDGGEGAETVFTGTVAVLRRRFDGLSLTARGPADLLALARPALALERVTAGEAIARLAGDAGVEVGDLADGPLLAVYVADGRSTALAEIARLAALSGASAHFDGEGALNLPDPASPGQPLALRYGREILFAESTEGSPGGAVPVVVGEGGDPNGTQSLWVLKDFLQGGAGGGPRVALPEIRRRADAQAAANALAAAQAARAKAVRLTTFLIPGLAPGLPLQLAEMPDGLPLARATLHQVVHTVSASEGALSQLWGTGYDAASGGLLGAALAAVGSVL